MEIFASYDLTRCAWSAAQLVGCDPKTVQRYVDLRDAGLDPFRRSRRARLIDPYLEKVEELVERSRGKIRADVVHDRLRAMGFCGNERTTRRAVATAKKAYRAGHRRRYHRAQVRAALGFREATVQDEEALAAWLAAEL